MAGSASCFGFGVNIMTYEISVGSSIHRRSWCFISTFQKQKYDQKAFDIIVAMIEQGHGDATIAKETAYLGKWR